MAHAARARAQMVLRTSSISAQIRAAESGLGAVLLSEAYLSIAGLRG